MYLLVTAGQQEKPDIENPEEIDEINGQLLNNRTMRAAAAESIL